MRAAVLLAAGLALSGCAPASTELSAASASQNQCFQARLARTYTRISPDTLLVEGVLQGGAARYLPGPGVDERGHLQGP